MVSNPETPGNAELATEPVSARPFTIDVIDNIADTRAAWVELSAVATTSPYQSCLFLSTWFDTVGREERLEAFIIVARDATGSPRALLPFAIDTRGPLRIAMFLGGRESNFNLALLRSGCRFDEKSIRALLRDAARRAANPPDVYYLRNQPRRFEGIENPLAFAGAMPSASFAYGVALPATEAELAARLSKESRKKLRKKEARLAEMGELRYEHRQTGPRAQEILNALIDQKSARFADMGVGGVFDGVGMREMLRRLSVETGEGSLELHALSVDGRIVATYAGLTRGGRFSALLNSFDMDEEVARCSPGDLLLHALMRDLVARGMTYFDLGAGEARYKNAVCDETIELCDTVTPASWKGVVAAPLLVIFLRAKRRIKQTPALARVFSRLRRLLRGRR
ncbi:GNAT family N-acetyltransferase [Methylocystis sp. ATCC 49242]|uniref:GNAT family N-acetyltransferase n=1 Tax=Methylocystis sp. ATCC 49242 TaxID=622637 RepID=UPI0001F888CB|nr:GNAT family N-acetyltransferase [Methylocystis sp. ATCC 49242]